MIKKITTLILSSFTSILMLANFKPLNELRLKSKFSTLLNVSISEIKNLNFYEFLNSWLGTRYKYAGNTKYGVDCSGFTQEIFKAIYNINLPRTSRDQFKVSNKIDKSELQEGDLLFFKTKGKFISHVGIYLQNNKFIHASVSNGVIVSDLNSPYYSSKFYKAGRI